MFYIGSILVIILTVILNYLQLIKGGSGSDQAIYLSIIKQIKNNGNKFISVRQDSLYNNEMVFPQLLYWLVSYLPNDFTVKFSKYISLIFSVLSTFSFIIFLIITSPYTNVDFDKLVFFGLLFFCFTPYSFNFNNAKNIGFSGRSLGLFLGSSYLYLLILFEITNNISYLMLALLTSFLIFLASQFAIQFILFSSILSLIFFFDFYPIVIQVLALIAYLVFFRKSAVNYIRLQIKHKINYYKYTSKAFILKSRYSVYRDFTKDFWGILFKKNKKSTGTGFLYIYTNPIIIAAFSIPLIPFFIYTNLVDGIIVNSTLLLSFYKIILICVLLFTLTSFRKTRFLGEPERYLEFSFGLISLWFIIAFQQNTFLLTIISSYCVLFSIFQVFYYIMFYSKKKSILNEGLINAVDAEIKKYSTKIGLINTDERVMSNNFQVTRLLANGDRKIFWGPQISDKVGKYNYAEVFTTYPICNDKFIVPIITNYQINFAVIDIKICPNIFLQFKTAEIGYIELLSVNNYKLYYLFKN